MRFLPVLFCSVCLMAQPAARTLLKGRVVDPEGRPVAQAKLTVGQGRTRELASVLTDREGRFSLAIPTFGYLRLHVDASAHLSGVLPLFVPKGSVLPLEARLPLIPWQRPAAPIPLMGLLNNQGLPKDAQLTEQTDGTWAWEIKAGAGEELQAGAMLPGGQVHPGHTADVYKEGTGIAYYRPHAGRIRFVLDPRRMGKAGEQVVFTGLDAAQDRFREAWQKVMRVTELYRATAKTGPVTEAQLTSMTGLLEGEAIAAKDGLASFYRVAEVSLLGASRQPIPKVLADKILAELGPDNYIWDANDPIVAAVVKATGDPKAALARLDAADPTHTFTMGSIRLMLGF